MAGWHHPLDGREFEQAPGDGEGRRAWRAAVHGSKESDTTEQQQQIRTHTFFFTFLPIVAIITGY